MCAFFLPFHWLLIGIEELTAFDLATWLVRQICGLCGAIAWRGWCRTKTADLGSVSTSW
jgi:hypothetical protein